MQFDADVVVAGAGPVGTCLAIDAAMRGLQVIVVEPRGADDPPDAKCNTIAARTMETFRRFGVADAVRAAGLPDDYPTDTLYAATLAGPEYTRIRMPSRAERTQRGFADDDWLTPEFMVRESQLYLEPILRKRMLAEPRIRFMTRAEVIGFEQDADGVDVRIRIVGGGAESSVRARYLAGCDGGASPTRKAMGAKLGGDAVLGKMRSTLIRSRAVRDLFGNRRPAWMTWVANSRIMGNVVAIDGEELWLVHRALRSVDDEFDSLDPDSSLREVLGVDHTFEYEVVSHQDWIGRRLVADRLRNGRVFLAGDAAHLWVPMAGYGMNAGIADGVSLSWLLSSVVNGWADPAILDAYEAERHPITDQVSRFAMESAVRNTAAMTGRAIPAALSWRGPVGALLRRKVGRRLHALNVPQMSPEGLNYGYYYDGSPIIAYDGEAAPTYDMGSLTPSTVPGCRLPHFRVDGTSILDRLGPDYTLLRFDPSVDVEPLLAAARGAGLPLELVDAERPVIGAAFRHQLLIVRVDQTVVWRDDRLPANVDALVAKLTGRTGTPPQRQAA
ncbi:FAD-dependent monooxygenase [Sphingomonas zeae]